MRRSWMGLVLVTLIVAQISFAASKEYLIKLDETTAEAERNFVESYGGKLEVVSKEGKLYKWTSTQDIDPTIVDDASVKGMQPNRPIRLFSNPSIEANKAALMKVYKEGGFPFEGLFGSAKDNPAIKSPAVQANGSDPLLDQAWGIFKIGADNAWKNTAQGKDIIVAVTDTGVDYNHQDLIANMWRNKGEIPDNGIDDDKNGYVDDIVGWDFADNDNKPFDMTTSLLETVFMGGNPGHGTHVAGVIGAKHNNSVGTAGVAPQAKIMALRFIKEHGQGNTESAIKAIDYAVANGANIINASWGSQGEEKGDFALREAIQRAEKKGVIFVAAAGNGRPTTGGYDNDSDAKPSYPASYPYKNIVSVAATDSNEGLAKFSNWGKKTVHIGAPGVKILSTVPGDKYQHSVLEIGALKAHWDGTSMAAPFVAGSLAVIWSQDRTATWDKVREKLLSEATTIPSLKGKVVTDARLELKNLK